MSSLELDLDLQETSLEVGFEDTLGVTEGLSRCFDSTGALIFEYRPPRIFREILSEDVTPEHLVRIGKYGSIVKRSVLQEAIHLALKRPGGSYTYLPLCCPSCTVNGIEHTFDYLVITAEGKYEGACGVCGKNFEFALC